MRKLPRTISSPLQRSHRTPLCSPAPNASLTSYLQTILNSCPVKCGLPSTFEFFLPIFLYEEPPGLESFLPRPFGWVGGGGDLISTYNKLLYYTCILKITSFPALGFLPVSRGPCGEHGDSCPILGPAGAGQGSRGSPRGSRSEAPPWEAHRSKAMGLNNTSVSARISSGLNSPRRGRSKNGCFQKSSTQRTRAKRLCPGLI